LASTSLVGGKEVPNNEDLWQIAGMALPTPTLVDEDTIRVTYTISLRVCATEPKSVQ